MAERNGIKVFVSSTVYDFETQLTDVFAMLDSMGYEVYMSKKGTIPLDSTLNTFVEQEIDAAIACGMPRFVMADYRVEYAHKFLSMMHLEPESIPAVIVKHKEEDGKKKEYHIPNNLIHPHTVRMYRTAVRRDVRPESERTGNWVQPFHVVREYCELNDIRTFIEAQFHDVERVRGLIAKCKGL